MSSGLHTITKKESEIVMKEKKAKLSVMGVVLIPPALLILLLADLLHPLPVIIFDLFLALLFLFRAGPVFRFFSQQRHEMALSANLMGPKAQRAAAFRQARQRKRNR